MSGNLLASFKAFEDLSVPTAPSQLWLEPKTRLSENDTTLACLLQQATALVTRSWCTQLSEGLKRLNRLSPVLCKLLPRSSHGLTEAFRVGTQCYSKVSMTGELTRCFTSAKARLVSTEEAPREYALLRGIGWAGIKARLVGNVKFFWVI